MSNIFGCLTCGQILISETRTSHKCEVKTTKSKDILATKILTMENNDGEKCALIYGFDGVCYRITEKAAKIVPVESPADLHINYQPIGNRHNFNLEGDSAILIKKPSG